jgi:U3 small nucleolar RNA-associated protein 6
MKQFDNDDGLGQKFYDMVAAFKETPCLQTVLAHIVQQMFTSAPASYHTQICHIKLPTEGISTTSAEFPRAFGVSLTRLKSCMPNPAQNRDLTREVVNWLQPITEMKELDPALRTVLTATLRRADRAVQQNLNSKSVVK